MIGPTAPDREKTTAKLTGISRPTMAIPATASSPYCAIDRVTIARWDSGRNRCELSLLLGAKGRNVDTLSVHLHRVHALEVACGKEVEGGVVIAKKLLLFFYAAGLWGPDLVDADLIHLRPVS